MPSLISDIQKASLQSAMSDIHDTFAREIKAFKDGKHVTLNSNPSYSHIYKSSTPNTTVQKIEKTILARIYYPESKQNKSTVQLTSSDYVKLAQFAAVVRIKIAKDDWEFMKDCERVTLDDSVFQITSTGMPHGLFGSGFYTLNLQRVT